MGGEIIKDLLSKVDLDTLNKELRRTLKETTTELSESQAYQKIKGR
jgi:hypothetical protein